MSKVKMYGVRLLVLLMASAMMMAGQPQTASAAPLSLTVDGVTVQGALAEITDGQMMVAVRPMVEAMGGGVNWLNSQQRATVQYDGHEMALWIGTHLAYMNGSRMYAPVAPYIRGGKMLVPAWWLAVRLGAKVSFTGSTLVVETGDYNQGPSRRPDQPSQHPLMNSSFVFPFPAGAVYEKYYDGYGDPRNYKGRNFAHEGIDILAKKGTPIVSVAAGTVVRFGWNTLGGYRVTIQLDSAPQYRFYYAHLDRYAPGLYQGARVKTGQLLGYVGSTGEGPERTEGKFVDHLHFGIYAPDGAINPFPFLKYWESNKASIR